MRKEVIYMKNIIYTATAKSVRKVITYVITARANRIDFRPTQIIKKVYSNGQDVYKV